jgi:DNA-binding IclR family transcriptional regulator
MSVKSAERTLLILEAFAEACQPLALSELARRIAIPVSACHGLVRTLAAHGYLYELGSRRGYYPTLRWLENARTIAAHDPVAERVAPFLAGLADDTGESVLLGRQLGDRVIYLLVIESRNSIRYSVHASSAGKALLGAMSGDERTALLANLELTRVTPGTITSREALEKDIAAGQARGWYATRGENVADVHAIAAPVTLGGQVHAVVVAGPAPRMQSALAAHVKRLQRTCKAIEAAPRGSA